MKCYWCKEHKLIHKEVEMFPIDPIGSRNRRWVCKECLSALPVPLINYYVKRGKRRTFRLAIKVFLYRIGEVFNA